MPSINNIKTLYKAKSFAELETKCGLPPGFSSATTGNNKIRSSNTLYKKGDEYYRDGDEELAYVYFMKYQKIFELVRSNEKDQYMREIGQQTMNVITKLERLKESLTKRYKELEETNNQRRSIAFSQSTNEENASSSEAKLKTIGNDDNCDIYQTITPNKLVEEIESLSKIENILLIDIRTASQFRESSISAAKFRVNCIMHVMNLPKDSFQPGVAFNQLEKNLQNSGFPKEALDQRNNMKNIVIIDTDDCPVIDEYHSKPSVILADILYKWDLSPNKIKIKPKILKGGFEDFLCCYPTYVTNSNVINNNYQINNPKTEIKGFSEYGEKKEAKPSEDVTKQPESQPVPMAVSNGTVPYRSPFIANNGFSDIPSSIKIPGVAKPVIPDRSSKPSIVTSSHSPNDVDMKPLDEPKSILINKNNNFQSHKNGLPCNNDDDSDEEMIVGEFDDIQKRKACPPTPLQKRKEFNDVELMDHDGDAGLAGQIVRSNPISMPKRNGHSSTFGPSSSLSRSLSSPNVAQFDEMQSPFSSVGSSKVSNGTPFIDRTMKPQIQVSKRYEFHPKEREFGLQYTSKYGLPVGLKNLGNTCFMNAVLQCLNNTSDLANYLRCGDVHINKKSKFGTNGELAIEFLELLKIMTFPSTYKSISPKNLKDAVNQHIPDFYDYKQQDAHEFLVRFLDRVHSDMNENESRFVEDPAANDPNFYDALSNSTAAKRFWSFHLSRNDSIISRLFDGLILGMLRCLDCDYTSKSLEAFTCLSLPVQENSGRTSIQMSLNNFLKTEKIEAEWHCPRCREKRNAEKSTFIRKLPKYLVIHLKRFSYEGLWRQKITTFVDFPIDGFKFDASDSEMKFYDLYGVVNHSGSLEGGHYIAYSRNIGSFDWHRYDDSDVTPANSSDVVTANAYVLFYQQRDN